ncbi:helix-hairpin-helix domain-containing protein [Ornithinimicrobium avium]|uniref:ComEA family DNA-binding protein n=1 Tax=Ornithinimicrobium avium TaxID=2283195 RepID=A0A345NL76_9MICO|nr:helix-hairpin-helix domain-containing protein [Ornithinimicrobium avium]AXH95784.1 ComEA family DNA-binding protein [Ornithinimicrobium avium]
MVSRRPSLPPSDRLARLLQETGDDAAGAAGTPRDGQTHDEGEGRRPLDQDDGWNLLDPHDDWEHLDPDDGVLPGGRHRRVAAPSSRVPLLSVPAALRSAQLAVGSRAVRGLLVLAAVAVLVLGGRWLWSQRPAQASGVDRVAELEVGQGGGAPGQAGPDEAADTAGFAKDGTADAAAPAEEGGKEGGGADTAGEPAAVLVVHVTGQVGKPGVVELPAGSRVVDGVRAAGGLTDGADQSSVNLARPLVDGEQLWVGRPGEEPPAGWVSPGVPGGRGGGPAGGGPAADAAGPVPIDLNTATQAALEELPGVGPVTAGHILAWRDEHGRFSRVDELLEVSGIGEKTLTQLEPYVTVGG